MCCQPCAHKPRARMGSTRARTVATMRARVLPSVAMRARVMPPFTHARMATYHACTVTFISGWCINIKSSRIHAHTDTIRAHMVVTIFTRAHMVVTTFTRAHMVATTFTRSRMGATHSRTETMRPVLCACSCMGAAHSRTGQTARARGVQVAQQVISCTCSCTCRCPCGSETCTRAWPSCSCRP